MSAFPECDSRMAAAMRWPPELTALWLKVMTWPGAIVKFVKSGKHVVNVDFSAVLFVKKDRTHGEMRSGASMANTTKEEDKISKQPINSSSLHFIYE